MVKSKEICWTSHLQQLILSSIFPSLLKPLFSAFLTLTQESMQQQIVLTESFAPFQNIECNRFGRMRASLFLMTAAVDNLRSLPWLVEVSIIIKSAKPRR